VVSGWKINLSKSETIPINEVDDVERLASIFGCRVAVLPMKYLGLPLGAPYKSATICNGIVEMKMRFAGWKRLYLSKGRRLTLIKSTVSNLPTYYLSLFHVPLSATNRIEKLQRDFLWRGIKEEFKFHQVQWSTISSPLQYGDLGVRNLIQFNQALLGKWLWHYATEREVLWRVVVEAKYDRLSGG